MALEQSMKQYLTIYCLSILFIFLQFMTVNYARTGENDDTITLDQVFFGTLLLKLEEGSGEHISAPLLSSRYDIDITGVIARTTLTQHFKNSSDLWLEGVYAFPLTRCNSQDFSKKQSPDLRKRNLNQGSQERKNLLRVPNLPHPVPASLSPNWGISSPTSMSSNRTKKSPWAITPNPVSGNGH